MCGWAEARFSAQPQGVASIGFHLRHVPGSLERLLTYADGQALTKGQIAAIPSEGIDDGIPLSQLLTELREAKDRTLERDSSTDPDSLPEPRSVGRAGLPSTRLGLLFHTAEHARRHAGQVVATAAIIRGLGLADE